MATALFVFFANMMAMFVSVGAEILSNFKYVSICTPYAYHSVVPGTDDWILKSVAATVIMVVIYVIGSVRFCKKNLLLIRRHDITVYS